MDTILLCYGFACAAVGALGSLSWCTLRFRRNQFAHLLELLLTCNEYGMVEWDADEHGYLYAITCGHVLGFDMDHNAPMCFYRERESIVRRRMTAGQRRAILTAYLHHERKEAGHDVGA